MESEINRVQVIIIMFCIYCLGKPTYKGNWKWFSKLFYCCKV